MNRPPLNLKSRRRGFTLIELLVVVIIIATLIALLIPAIASAVRAARNAAVQAEINQLAQALADFKSKYGDYPPSRIVLNENGYIPTGGTVNSGGYFLTVATPTDITLTQLANRTQNAMRKFWPRAPFTLGNSIAATGGTWYDFNGNGVQDNTSPFILQGHECLVFFLGGIPLRANGQISVIGFAKDPVNPFKHGIVTTPLSPMYSANRNNPFYQFDSNRLVLTDVAEYPAGNTAYHPIIMTTIPPTGNPGYLDSLPSQGAQNFYAYFSTNNGSGYDPNDVNLQSDLDVDASGVHLALQFCAPLTAPSQIGGFAQRTFSPVPNPYTSSLTVPNLATSQSPTYINAQSFQIISAGNDGAYGSGGIYAVTGAGTTPELTALPQNNFSNSTTDAGIRVLERDNLTNFHSGKLE